MTATRATPVTEPGPVRTVRSAPASARPDRAPTRRGARTLVNVVLGLYVLYSVMPLVAMLSLINKDTAGIDGTSLFSVHGFHLWQNISTVFSYDGGIYLRWYGNTLLYALAGAALQALICCATGYAFDKFEFRFKKPLFMTVLVGSLIPMPVLMLPQYLVFSKLGLVNTVFAILIPSMVNPAGVFLARVFSSSYIPDEVVEAARIDGAGEGRIFRSISMRLLMPGFATIAIFAFTGIWQGFQLALIMLTNDHLYPVQLGLWNMYVSAQSQGDSPQLLPVALTGSALAVIPLIVVMVCLQRFWKAGLTGGSIK